MYVSFDDTDSNKGLCTTYLATEVIDKINLDLIGYPRLIRLNPAVPWKTRGNGSLFMKFGKGYGVKKEIGEINGKKIYSYLKSKKIFMDESELMEELLPIIKNNRCPESDTGVIVSRKKPSPFLYWKGVKQIVEKQEVLDILNEIGAEYHEFGNGRGLIGAACAMACRPRDRTYEYIAYRKKENWGTEREFDRYSVKEMDEKVTSTFNNWEEETQKPCIFPGTPCPVLYGIRGDSYADLFKAADLVKTETVDRHVIFQTNQGSDDHVLRKFDSLIPLSSYQIEGKVVKIEKIPGGHLIFVVETSFGNVDCTVYEPAKTFRNAITWLSPGDCVEVIGELRETPRTLNVEKLNVVSLTKELEKISNPLCEVCGRRMESVGKNKGYRCRDCKTTSSEAIYKENIRWILPGWYEPPPSARRHLSKPLKRMNEEQPLSFVNSRI